MSDIDQIIAEIRDGSLNRDAITALADAYEEMVANCEALERVQEGTQRDFDNARKERDAALADIHKLAGQVDDLREDVSILADGAKTQEAQLARLREERDRLNLVHKNEQQSMVEEIERLDKLARKYAGESDRLKARVDELEQANTTDKALWDSRAAHYALAEKNRDLEARVVSLTAEVDVLSAKLRSAAEMLQTISSSGYSDEYERGWNAAVRHNRQVLMNQDAK